MVTDLRIPDKSFFGPNGKNVVGLIERIASIEWFSAIEAENREVSESAINEFKKSFNLNEFQINWISKSELQPLLAGMSFETSQLWSELQSVQSAMNKKAEEMDRLHLITYAVSDVPELVFHQLFDGAFREFEQHGEEVLKIAVGTIVYIVGLACAWETIADIDGWENNQLLSLIQVYEQGHWPIGLINNQFCSI